MVRNQFLKNKINTRVDFFENKGSKPIRSTQGLIFEDNGSKPILENKINTRVDF